MRQYLDRWHMYFSLSYYLLFCLFEKSLLSGATDIQRYYELSGT